MPFPSNPSPWPLPPPAVGAVPPGTICAYAGYVEPESTASNKVFSCSGSDDAADPAEAAAPSAPSGVPIVKIEALGWMVCDGRTLEVAKYPELYGALGTLYGDEGGGTFKIPDGRGLFLRGVDSGSGMDPDAAERTAANGSGQGDGPGSVQCDALVDHVHSYQAAPPPSSPGKSGKSATSPGEATATGPAAEPGSVSPARPNGKPIGKKETRPRNIAVNYLIRYRW